VEPNPAAIAWYVEEAQRLLEDQQRRVESLRTRGAQVAGFGAAVLALTAGNVAVLLKASGGSTRIAIGGALFAAVICLAAAVGIAIWGVVGTRPLVSLAADEVAIYISDRFLCEPDLWRVHLRSLKALRKATREAQEVENNAATAMRISLYALLLGLGFSLISLGTLIFELIR
jgi:hypothetical protein